MEVTAAEGARDDTGVAVDNVDRSCEMVHPHERYTTRQAQPNKQAAHKSPALDGAVVGMEVTAAEGARDDTGVAVDDV